MFDKNRYTPEGRGADMLAAFKRSAKECGYIARDADGDIPARYLAEMCELSVHLQAQLVGMRERQSRKSAL